MHSCQWSNYLKSTPFVKCFSWLNILRKKLNLQQFKYYAQYHLYQMALSNTFLPSKRNLPRCVCFLIFHEIGALAWSDYNHLYLLTKKSLETNAIVGSHRCSFPWRWDSSPCCQRNWNKEGVWRSVMGFPYRHLTKERKDDSHCNTFP